jgi:hypothetical protein
MYPDSKIGYRGSLARGTTYSGGAFDPGDFDVDAFIVSDNLASSDFFEPNEPWRDARDVDNLEGICDNLNKTFKNNFPGYLKTPRKPFTFKVYTKAEYRNEIVKDKYCILVQ